jgi:type IV pilus assembly protein PilC
MTLIVILIVYFLMPRILPVFESLKIDLPPLTKIFIFISTFLLKYGIYIILFFIFSLILLFLLLRNEKFKYYFHFFLLRIPFISDILKKFEMAEISRSLGILLESGIHIVDALRLLGRNINNRVYRKVILKCSDLVAEGHSLSESLDKYSLIFFYNFIKMIDIGEKTGNLINNLFYLSENYEFEIDSTLERMVNMLEPLILVIISIIVGFVALSIILPIYELSDQLQK